MFVPCILNSISKTSNYIIKSGTQCSSFEQTALFEFSVLLRFQIEFSQLRFPMNLLRLLLTLLITSATAFTAYAQRTGGTGNTDGDNETSKTDERSPDSVFVSYFSLNEQGAYTRYAVSKPLDHFQEYDVAKQYNKFYANTGNAGSASYPLQFSLKPNSDFRFKTDVFEPYQLKDDSIKFYISDSPFSHLRYHLGTAKEQKLDLVFSQRIGSGLYLGLNARFANAPGLYLRQRSYYAGATVYAAFLYPTQRYGALVTYRNDRLVNYENGGLTDVNYFFQNIESNRKVIPTNLSKALNRGKGSGIVFQQYFNILKPKLVHKTDSTTVLVPRKFDAGRFVHTFRYSRTGNAYEDLDLPNSFNFYPVFYNDSLSVLDSVFYTHFENCLVYSNEVPDTLGKSFPLQYSFGLRFQTNKLHQDTIDKVFHQTIPFGMLKGIIRQKTFFKATANLVLGGYNNGDYTLDGSFYQFFGKQNHKAYINVLKGLSHPDYYFNHYIADNFRWNNSFSAQDYLKGEFGVVLKGFDLNASYIRMTNYTYLDQRIIPVQYTGALTVLSGHISKELKIKHWITTIYASAQQVTPDSILQLPALIGKLSVCYDVVLFKNALHAQLGISGTYHSEWFQDAYMPALRAFYRQNNYLAGNYPYLDVFVNLNIKRARIFIKYEHFNAGLMNYNYMIIPGYPMADAAFKFGISWLFFD